MSNTHVPAGYHAVTPAIVVRNAPAAIEFYKTAFGAEELHRMLGPDGSIAHAEIRIGDSVIINTNAVVDHECDIGPAVHVCPGALLAGRVRVGAGAFVGLGAKIIQCISVGEEATIGAGAVVLTDVPAYATAVGIPARVIKIPTRAA